MSLTSSRPQRQRHEHQPRALSPQAGLRASIMSIRYQRRPLTSSQPQGQHHEHQRRALSPQSLNRPQRQHHEHQRRALSPQAGLRASIMNIRGVPSHLKPAPTPAS